MRLRNDMDLSESPHGLVMSLIALCAIKSRLDNDTVHLHRMFASRSARHCSGKYVTDSAQLDDERPGQYGQWQVAHRQALFDVLPYPLIQ